ncbi:hypothetical protein I4U23_020135 [Adineta vaga]|nr:hypothetical protein I4U23_020135 [Adineta vaga]
MNETNVSLVEQSELFRQVATTNKITNLTINELISIENIKLPTLLCSRMQHLTINQYGQYVQSSIQFILSKSKNDLQYLCSLRARNFHKPMLSIVKTLIESEELLDNYLIKLIDADLYLWW